MLTSRYGLPRRASIAAASSGRRTADVLGAALACVLLVAGTPLRAQGGDVAETVGVASLPPATPYRLYVADVAITHIVDGKVHILDGRKMKYEGTIATALAGNATLSPDRSELYVATTYFTRLNRGERVDQVDVYDAGTLKLTAEIGIPPKHAQALPYRGLLRASADGRWLFVQNATPATSVSVVDLKAHKFVVEVPTPGCWALLTVPSESTRFTTICGDGSLLTVTLDAEGKVATQRRVAKFFDPDTDPIFIHAEYEGDQVHFVSFKGMLHTARLGGEEARFEAPRPLVTGADTKGGWRPGGYQPIALHAQSRRLFVGMHPGGKEGSHKEPAREIWVYDLAAGKRVARIPGSTAIALAVTRGDKPLLFAIDGAKNALVSWDVQAAPRLRAQRLAPMGDSATLIEVQ
jgi:methylamine dehydrogenase heavy chain